MILKLIANLQLQSVLFQQGGIYIHVASFGQNVKDKSPQQRMIERCHTNYNQILFLTIATLHGMSFFNVVKHSSNPERQQS